MPTIELQQSYDGIAQILTLIVDIRQRLDQFHTQNGVSAGSDLLIYGAGLSGQIAYEACRNRHRIIALLDNDPTLTGSSFFDSPIHTPASFDSQAPPTIMIALSPTHYTDVCKTLDTHPHLKQANKLFLFAPDPRQNTVTANSRTGSTCLGLDYSWIDYINETARRLIPLIAPEQKSPDIAIYSCGIAGLLALHACRFAAIPVSACYDQDTAKQGQHLFGIEILAPETMPPDGTRYLLVALAPQHLRGFTGHHRSLMAHFTTVQFLFKKRPRTKQAPSVKGKPFERILGFGSESMVYIARSTSGKRITLKVFKKPVSISPLHERIADDPCRPESLPPVRYDRINETHAHALWYPYERLHPISQHALSQTTTMKCCFGAYLDMQRYFIQQLRHVSAERFNGNIMCTKQGKIRFVDIGQNMLPIATTQASIIRKHVLQAALSLCYAQCRDLLRPELPADDLPAFARQHMVRIAENVPSWFSTCLNHICNTPATEFIRQTGYDEKQKKLTIDTHTIPQDECRAIVEPLAGIPPGPTAPNDQGLQETEYQTFYYGPGYVSAYGPTSRKMALCERTLLPLVKNKSYLDIGANAGFFVIKAAMAGARKATGIDGNLHCSMKARRIAHFTRASNTEFITRWLPDRRIRRQWEVVSLFSIIHHLYFGTDRFASMSNLVSYLCSLCTDTLILEFVAPEPQNFTSYRTNTLALPRARDYNEHTLQRSLAMHFKVIKKLGTTFDPSRSIYLASGKIA